MTQEGIIPTPWGPIRPDITTCVVILPDGSVLDEDDPVQAAQFDMQLMYAARGLRCPRAVFDAAGEEARAEGRGQCVDTYA